MIASATYHLREVFGAQHALAVTADLVGPLVATSEPLPGEAAAPVEIPPVVLH